MLRIFGTALLFVVTAGQALAADLPVPGSGPVVAAPIYAPIYNWGGIYAGINGGGVFGSSSWSDPQNPAGNTGDFNVNGGLIGGTLGVNYQADSWVFGAEGDFNWQSVKGSSSSSFCTDVGTIHKPLPPATVGVFVSSGLSCTTQSNWLGTIRGRVGYAWNYLFLYGTAGGAWANMKTTVLSGETSNAFGWTAGLGLEYAFADRWSAKLEYLFVDFSSISCTSGGCGFNPPLGIAANDSVKFNENVIRVGVNYKFPP
jgi:outer membrane immunogenic protein